MKKIIFVILITVFPACIDIPDDIILPEWDSELNLPIKTGKYFISEIIDSVKNSNILLRDTLYFGSDYFYDSVYFITTEETKSTLKITDSVKIPFNISSDTLYLYGNTGGGIIVNGLIYNPSPDYHLISAEFRRGIFNLTLKNLTPSDGFYEIIIPGFKKRTNNLIMRSSGSISSGGVIDIQFDLSEYVYNELPILGFNDYENFTSQEAPGFLFVGKISSNNPVVINVNTTISNNELIISKLRGSIKRIVFPYEEEEFSTGFGEDLKDLRNNIKFDDLKIKIDLNTLGDLNNIKIISDSLTFITYEKSPQGVVIDSSKILFNNLEYLRTELIAGQPLSLTFDKTNTNLQEIITKFPKYIKMGNRFIIDKSNLAIQEQTLSDDAKIVYSGKISAPLSFALKNMTYADTIKLFKNENEDGYLSNNDKDKLKKAKAARLSFDIENYTGLGFISSVRFLDERKNTLFTLRTSDNQNRILVPSAVIDQNGKPLAPGKTQSLFIELNSDEITTLLDYAKFILVDVALYSYNSNPNTFGPYVRLRAKDYIKYKISGMIKYQIGGKE